MSTVEASGASRHRLLTTRKDPVSIGIGDALRGAREAQGRSLEDAAQSLRARVTLLRALEEEDFATFGGDVYAKGFLKSYAVDVGLDPEPLLDTYRREIGQDDVRATTLVSGMSGQPRPPRNAPPAWVAFILVGVVVVAGIGFISQQGSGRTPPVASQDEPQGPPPAPATNDAGPEDDATDDGDAEPSAPAPAPAPAPEPEPEFEGVELLLALEASSWMRVVVDGSVVSEQTVEAGETIPFRGEQEIEIRFGNPGGVRAELNGEDLGPQGESGQPVTVRYTPDGVETL